MSVRAVVFEAVGLRPSPVWGLVALAAAFFLGFFLLLGDGSLRQGALAWWGLTNGLNASLQGPLGGLAQGSGLPFLAVALFGLLGTTAPCQLSTNAAALAYVIQGGADPARIGKATSGYLVGKLAVYGVLGGVVLLMGREAASGAIPLIEVVRKGLGPLMVVLGLVLLGALRPNVALGQGVSARLRELAPRSAFPGGAALGLAFGLAFCPTLFLLFFGLTIPLALASPAGALYPLLFGLGTMVPLLVLAGLAAAGRDAAGGSLRAFAALDRFLRPAAAVVLLLAGFNDTFVYWFL